MADVEIRHPGTLKSCGYSTNDSSSTRHEALKKAIKKYGKDEVIRKVNALVVLNKGRPELHKKYAMDLEYVMRRK